MKLQLESINLQYQTVEFETGERSTLLTESDGRGQVHLSSGLSVQVTEELTPDEEEALKGIIASIEKRVVEKIKASI